MSTITIKIPISKAIQEEAEAASKAAGFASLSDALAAFMHKFVKREVMLSREEKTIHLSKRAEKRYAKDIADIKAGRNIYTPQDDEEFFKLLRE